jgi:hypothetical protein
MAEKPASSDSSSMREQRRYAAQRLKSLLR